MRAWLYLMFLPVFFSQGVSDVLCEACEKIGWKKPTKIQRECIPLALQGLLLNFIETREFRC